MNRMAAILITTRESSQLQAQQREARAAQHQMSPIITLFLAKDWRPRSLTGVWFRF